MTFGEKLAELVAPGRRSKMALAAGLPPNAISDYINKGYLPKLDTALALAKVLGVSLDWLANDELLPPPPRPTDSAIQNVPEGFLMREVCRRLRLASIDVRELIDKANRVDWQSIIDQLLSQPADSPFPPGVDHEIRLAASLFFADSSLRKFEASYAMKAHWRDLPPVELSETELDPDRLQSQLRTLNHGTYCGAAQFYLFLLATEDKHPDPAAVANARDKLRSELAKIDQSFAAKGSFEKSGSKPLSRK